MKKGWEIKTLEEIIERTETIDPTRSPELSFQYVDISSVSNESFKIITSTEILGCNAPSRARKVIRSGDVIFATVRPTLKRIAQVPDYLDGQICSTGFTVLRPSSKVMSRYLYHFLLSKQFIQLMEQLQSGTSYPAVTDRQVKCSSIPLPPLAEQKHIVAILDEAFDGLDCARANIEKNLVDLNNLRQSLLQKAFFGELT